MIQTNHIILSGSIHPLSVCLDMLVTHVVCLLKPSFNLNKELWWTRQKLVCKMYCYGIFQLLDDGPDHHTHIYL